MIIIFPLYRFQTQKLRKKLAERLRNSPSYFFQWMLVNWMLTPNVQQKKKIDSAQIKQYKRVKGNTFKSVCNTFLINWPIKQNHSFLRPFTAKWRDNEHCECFCIPLPLPTYCIEQHLPSQLLFFLLHCQYYFVHSCPIWINLVCFFRCPYSSTFLHTKQQCVCVFVCLLHLLLLSVRSKRLIYTCAHRFWQQRQQQQQQQ